MKSGTTSLCDYLSRSNDIFIPEVKEPHYFVASEVSRAHSDICIPSLQVIESNSAYKKIFAKASPGQMKGESSVSYFYYLNEFINSVSHKYGQEARKIKIVLVVRNPVARAMSQAKSFMQYHVVNTREELIEFVRENADSRHFVYDVLGSSEYSSKFKILRDSFDEVFVLKGEYLRENPETALHELSGFLEIPRFEIERSVTTNVSGFHRYPILASLDKYSRKTGLLRFTKYALGPTVSRKLKDKYHDFALTKNVDLTAIEEYLNKVLKIDMLSYKGYGNIFKL